jgi:3-methyladenine DNA glycosylase AlkC
MTRRGARRPNAVPADVLRALERGEESANHMEQIALDMGALLCALFPSLSHRADALRHGGLVTRMRTGGAVVLAEMGSGAISAGSSWQSDTARGWAAMAVGLAEGPTLADRLVSIRPYADDRHFAVREWAWLSLRRHVVARPEHAIRLLEPWAAEESERLRRFATELTRPRGVWSAHIPLLKTMPELGLPLLEPLRADRSRYVQDSVSNWLNDAAKSRPHWVDTTCKRWLRQTDRATTERIVRRAMRSLPTGPRQGS